MFPWRKLQAGLRGKGDEKSVGDVIQQISNTTITQMLDTNPASYTRAGVIRIAEGWEVSGGTDSSIAVSPDDLSFSSYGRRVIGVLVEAGDTTLGTGDAKNGNFFRIPDNLNGWDIISVAACHWTSGSGGSTSIQLRNVTDGSDVLSTKLTIDGSETDSLTAANAAVINTANDGVATGDKFTWDVDTITGSAASGLFCEAILRHP